MGPGLFGVLYRQSASIYSYPHREDDIKTINLFDIYNYINVYQSLSGERSRTIRVFFEAPSASLFVKRTYNICENYWPSGGNNPIIIGCLPPYFPITGISPNF